MDRLRVDWTACAGNGLCTELLPELLTTDDWGYPLFREDTTVPEHLYAHANRAVKLCPRLALSLRRVP